MPLVGLRDPFLNICDPAPPISEIGDARLHISVICSSNNEGVQIFTMGSGNLGL